MITTGSIEPPASTPAGVIVADAPTAPPADTPREVHVRTVDASGPLDHAVVLTGPRGTPARARVGAGTAVACVEQDGAHVVVGRCTSP